jgi:transcriptional regulator with XRE-family HTH domain
MSNALRTYIDEHHGGKSISFSQATGISESAISRYLSGKSFPRQEHLRRIVQATKGRVTANDFFPPIPAHETADTPSN